jgi:hypothetical protein
VQLCNALLTALEERAQAQTRAGYRAVEANARTGVTSPSLETDRNYKMSWPQYARENAQRQELKVQAINKAEIIKEQPKAEWVVRTAAFRKSLDAFYAQYREALREPLAKK